MIGGHLIQSALGEAKDRLQSIYADGDHLSHLKGSCAGLRHPLWNQKTGAVRKHDVNLLPPRPPRLGDLELASRMAVVSVVDADSTAIPHKRGVLFGFAWGTISIWS